MPDLVCYCLRVEKPTIVAAIQNGCVTVDSLSSKLRVSTGCGGCRPDLEDLIRFYGEDIRSTDTPKPTSTVASIIPPVRPFPY